MDQIVNNGQLDTETKIARYYNPEKMHNAVFLMEQFYNQQAEKTQSSLVAAMNRQIKNLEFQYNV